MKQKLFLIISSLGDVLLDRLSLYWIRLKSSLGLCLFSKGEQDRLTEFCFQRDPRYLPQGEFYERGLFDWETALLKPLLSNPVHMVLLGAGAGREIQGLFEAFPDFTGRIVACEPNPKLFESLFQTWGQHPLVELHQLAAEDFFSHESKPIDLIWFGWGVFSHLTDPRSREILLTQCRRHTRAKVVMSFLLETSLYPARTYFFKHCGFVQYHTEGSIRDILKKAGYQIETFNTKPYPHLLAIVD